VTRTLVLLATVVAITGSEPAQACQRISSVSVFDVVDRADLIVLATAAEYALAPEGDRWTSGEPSSRIKFAVKEMLRGPNAMLMFELKGYLGDRNDFNDHDAPYTFVRPGGRGGSCYANTYRRGALYLLFLKKHADGYTVNWNALAPVNEQLHSETDPWLFWVKGYLAAKTTTLPER